MINYLRGIERLRKVLGQSSELDLLESNLRANLQREEGGKEDRLRIIDHFNVLSFERVGRSFTELCRER